MQGVEKRRYLAEGLLNASHQRGRGFKVAVCIDVFSQRLALCLCKVSVRIERLEKNICMCACV